MSLLKLPLTNRPDVHIFVFPPENDPDACAAKVLKDMTAHEYTGFFVPGRLPLVPVVRVVPLAEEAVYREAEALVCQRLQQQDPGSDPAPSGPGVVAFKCGRERAPAEQALRVLQCLGN